jgi:hypothetical protein
MQPFSMERYELEKILTKIDDLRFLGDSPLRHLRIVSEHFKNKAAPSSIERGLVIREVLSKALEVLRHKIREDEDSRLYKILYYKYFIRQPLPSNLIASKLAMSVRQFYREQSRAIDVLLMILISM